jgi:sporulation integral membrane protein YlbJ
MTANRENNRSASKEALTSIPFGSFFFCFISVFLLALTVKNADIAIRYMQTGLRLCAVSVIPSLFPFMVISELLVASGIGKLAERLAGRPFSRLFGISGTASAAILLGLLCGFPVGAKTTVSLYDKGYITKKEAERLLTVCNVPSSGFLISTVGVALFSDRTFGVFLFLAAILASLLTGVIGRLLSRPQQEIPCHADIKMPTVGVNTFTSAVSSATRSMLSVCAYVVFFSSLVGCLSHIADRFALPAAFSSFLFAFFEISSGANAAATLPNPIVAAVLCGFAVGWSGLSVHFQILTICGERELSFVPYFVAKLFQGVTCAVAAFGYTRLFPRLPVFAPPSAPVSLFDDPSFGLSYAISFFFFLCVILTLRGQRKKSNYQP